MFTTAQKRAATREVTAGTAFEAELIMPCGILVHDADRGSEHRETCDTCRIQPYTATREDDQDGSHED